MSNTRLRIRSTRKSKPLGPVQAARLRDELASVRATASSLVEQVKTLQRVTLGNSQQTSKEMGEQRVHYTAIIDGLMLRATRAERMWRLTVALVAELTKVLQTTESEKGQS